jgi:hypothetical protein
MGAEALQSLDMGGSESEWIAFEFLQHASIPLSAAPMARKLTLSAGKVLSKTCGKFTTLNIFCIKHAVIFGYFTKMRKILSCTARLTGSA